jgi:hypothetical protein
MPTVFPEHFLHGQYLPRMRSHGRVLRPDL